jgi:hypothetical protein
MTSSQLVRYRQLDAQLEGAGKAGDIARMQKLLGERTDLMASIYGRPKVTVGQ